MADRLYTFASKPGVRRDGTDLDSPYFNDGEWVRWQRGQPRKMGGYKVSTELANGPVRSVFIDSRNGVNSAHYFSQYGIQRQQFDNTGSGSALTDRTPAGYVTNSLMNWSHAAMYSSTGGAYTALIACSAPDVLDIASDEEGGIYAGDITGTDTLTQIADGSGNILTSGGICVLQPFLFVYGSNGLIRNSNPNDFSTGSGWTTGGSNLASSANPAGTKIVYGAPLRGGSGAPSGLFWALDSLIRVSFNSASTAYPWQYDTISNPMSILSKKCVVEADGRFFWIGIDRFLTYNGVVQELPNDMNLNYFFDNLNWTYRNKVWGTKVGRWGEIWWFYPRGEDTECGNAIIYNYRENTWYDAVKKRTAGGAAQIYQYPIWAGHEDTKETKRLTVGVKTTNTAPIVSTNAFAVASVSGISVGMKVSGSSYIPNGTIVTALYPATASPLTVNVSAATTGTVPTDTVLTFTSMTTPFAIGSLITATPSGAVGYACRQTDIDVNVENVTGNFASNDTLAGINGGAAIVISDPINQELDAVYQHESGLDKINGQSIEAIRASFTSRNFGFAIGAPFDDTTPTVDCMTRILRMEQDFNQVGELTAYIHGRSFASDAVETIATYTIPEDSSFVDMREQARICSVKIETDSLGGFFEQGQVMINLQPGDERATKVT